MARSLAVWVVKLPVIWPEPPRIGSLDHGRRDHLLVEHDGEAVADIVLGDIAELRARRRVSKRKFTTGWPVCWSKPALASVRRSPATITRRCTTTWRRLVAASCRCIMRQDFVADRRGPAALGDRPLRPPAGSVILAVLPRMSLSRLGILQARHLHQDAVVALPLDGRFARAQLVDAAAHDFDGLVDDLLPASASCRRRSCAWRRRRRPARSCHIPWRPPTAPRWSWSGLRPCKQRCAPRRTRPASVTRTETVSPWRRGRYSRYAPCGSAARISPISDFDLVLLHLVEFALRAADRNRPADRGPG